MSGGSLPQERTDEILRSQASLLSLDENYGFAGNINRALRQIDDDVYCLCNDDTVMLSPTWEERVAALFACEDHIAAVGGVSNHILSHQMVKFPGPPIVRGTNRLSFMWICIRREAWEDVGELDEDFGLGLYEDDDWCRRAVAKGWHLVLDGGIFNWHFASQTINKLADYEELDARNKALLKEKYS